MKAEFVVGIDEVGRGPVAGPVYVCALLAPASAVSEIVAGAGLPLRDSKKLTKIQRGKWFAYLQKLAKEERFRYIISKTSAKEIDEKGIVVCIKACVDNCLLKLKIKKENTQVLLDGGLKTSYKLSQKTIIKGDESEPIISLASILAKVSRDAEMEKLAEKYPNYGLEKHKGYGTKAHMEAIKKHGLSDIHRKSFLKKI